MFQESRKELWLGMEVWNVGTGILEQRKVKPRFSDARLIQTPRYYGQFGLSQGKKALSFSLNSTRLAGHLAPSVSPYEMEYVWCGSTLSSEILSVVSNSLSYITIPNN